MKILIIDKDSGVLSSMSDKFLHDGHQVILATDVPLAIRTIYNELPDLILSQDSFSCMEGTELRKMINLQLRKHIPIVFFNSNQMSEMEVSDRDFEVNLQQVVYSMQKVA